jgi:lipopolysaccharide/colanic/teichoic acid biosynthesis glycosyltransferase
LYWQLLVGRYGRPFRLLKLRTMVDRAEQHGEPVWARDADPRVTRVGRLLRRSRLDELPQLLNVVHGDISFIGPRPERPEFVEMLRKEIPWYNTRHVVPPGITGWAQVKFPYGSSIQDAASKLEYDLYYIRHRSLLLDLTILLKTAAVMTRLGGR